MAESPATDLDAVDLHTLVGHAAAVPGATPVEHMQAEFARASADFLAVLGGENLLGLCARREIAQALGSRYGFALNARRPVREHLMARPLRVRLGTPATEVFQAASARDAREFYDDVLLVDAAGRYVGLIPMFTLVRLQTEFLLGNIARLEASRQEVAEKNRQMQADLDMAREVQLALLPPADATLAAGSAGLRIAHRYRPAGGVSGDFFDVLRVGDHATGLFICDVMGHGVRSALITAMVRTMVAELHPTAGDPGGLLTRLNADLTRLLRQTGSLIFVTAAYVVIDPARGRLRYAQAGHPTPLHWCASAQSIRPVAGAPETAGPALGLIDDFTFTASEAPVAAGDRVTLFTDGVFEARNFQGEEFGPERLAQTLARAAEQPLDAALSALLEAVTAFCGGVDFDDDVCVIGAEIAPAGTPKT